MIRLFVIGLFLAFPAHAADYRAEVVRVIDGDTVQIRIGQLEDRLRIKDIDTPEIGSPKCDEERALGMKAKRYAQRFLSSGPVTLSTDHERGGYGRLLGTLHVNGVSLSEALRGAGLAREWRGRREFWCDDQ